MIERIITLKLLRYAVLVNGQKLTQMKTTGVRARKDNYFLSQDTLPC